MAAHCGEKLAITYDKLVHPAFIWLPSEVTYNSHFHISVPTLSNDIIGSTLNSQTIKGLLIANVEHRC